MIGKYGFLKHSLVDYPGEVCSVIFIPGCNFHCPYCHNQTLDVDVVQHGWAIEEVEAYLKESRSLITAVCITGGEPTLSPCLTSLIRTFKTLGLKVKLDTNGSRPEILQEVISQVDYVAMDLKTSLRRYPELVNSKIEKIDLSKRIAASMRLLMQRNENMYEFRTTLAWEWIDEAALHDLGQCICKQTYWYLQRCRYANRKMTEIEYLRENDHIYRCYQVAKQHSDHVFFRS